MDTYAQEELRQQNEAASLLIASQATEIRELRVQLEKFEQVAQREDTILDSCIATAGRAEKHAFEAEQKVKAYQDNLKWCSICGNGWMDGPDCPYCKWRELDRDRDNLLEQLLKAIELQKENDRLGAVVEAARVIDNGRCECDVCRRLHDAFAKLDAK